MMKSKARIRLIQGGITLFSVLLSMSVMALPTNQRLSDTTPGNGSMVITGTVVLPPPCKVNNDQQTNVEFGDVRIDKIDGESYAIQEIPVSITCTGTPEGQLQLSLQGSAVSTKDSVLQTSVPGLGIRMKLNQQELPLNSWVDVTPDEDVSIVAIPITIAGNPLPAGEFTAAATLVIQAE